MPASCDLCAKHTMFGRNIRHKSTGRWQRKAHRTPRQFKPNLQHQVLWRNGRRVRMRLCTRCLRSQVKVVS
jgi:large subunit ribosomal protein L28